MEQLEDTVSLSQGSGGEETAKFIKNTFSEYLSNPLLDKSEDGAVVAMPNKVVLTTDTFTVKPLIFAGGDIGKLSIAGICNDLAVMAAKPLYMTMTFVIEEGFSIKKLKIILNSIKKELAINNIFIVAADTKVVGKNNADGIFISASGVGEVIKKDVSIYNAKVGDEIVVSGCVGDHGAVVLMEQSEFSMQSELQSDCKSLWPSIENLISKTDVTAMRDVTRGGLATILNEWAAQSKLSINVREQAIPIKQEVRGFCEILGFHPYQLACEGSFIAALKPGEGEKAVALLQDMGFADACVIGSFVETAINPDLDNTVNNNQKQTAQVPSGQVVLETASGSRRRLEPVRGELLPRIC